MFQRRKNVQGFAEEEISDCGRDDTNTSHAWVTLYTLMFPDAY